MENVEQMKARFGQASQEKPRAVAQPQAVTQLDATSEPGELAVMAPYWLNGVHNKQGIELAKRINAGLDDEDRHIIRNPQSIQKLMNTLHPEAKRLGLHIVTMEQYRTDELLKANPAEPASLLAGAFTRDKEGAYRPSAGGPVVIQDRGDAVDLTSESHDAYQAFIELAKAKGLKPTELDLARLAKAFADQGGLPAQAQPVQQEPETEATEHSQTMQAVRESWDEIMPATDGHHVGPIVAVDGQFICQKTGRDPKQIIWHDTKKMDGHVPSIGQSAEIRYQGGRGHAINKTLEQGVSR
ncbi:hypothetical protein LBW59_16735 [Ralstonia solanacearum]|uniref:KfrB domain-containing protein n=1 Tax=Ralstonia solanacearum TaxID=305 RepID=A0AAW5ZQY2_RALSL|nr:hypothetical protein [Ralstonia solanacearum]MDB0572409.1 hypothetical protein [Ralstonia solanacearum]